MPIEVDPDKDAINREKHGVFLARAAEMEILGFKEDIRFDYGERRFWAFGLIDLTPHCLSLTLRGGVVRAISPPPGASQGVQT